MTSDERNGVRTPWPGAGWLRDRLGAAGPPGALAASALVLMVGVTLLVLVMWMLGLLAKSGAVAAVRLVRLPPCWLGDHRVERVHRDRQLRGHRSGLGGRRHRLGPVPAGGAAAAAAGDGAGGEIPAAGHRRAGAGAAAPGGAGDRASRRLPVRRVGAGRAGGRHGGLAD